MEWQPIETAPKDGSWVLLYLRHPWSEIEKAFWYNAWQNWQTTIPEEGGEFCGIGAAVPTHWMELPEPPEEL